MFIRVIPKPVIDEFSFLLFLPIILSLASTRISLFNLLVYVFFNSFTNEFVIEFAGDHIISSNILGVANRSPPNCTILDN